MLPSRSFALLLTGALALSACTGGDDAGDDLDSTAESIVPAQFGWQIQGVTSFANTPQFRWNFTVSQPLAEVDFATASEQEINPSAPEGMAFVGVGWDREISGGEGWLLASAGRARPSTELTVVVDGVDYELGPIDVPEEPDGAYVVVPQDSDEVSLEIEYDGYVQTIEDPYSPTGRRAIGPLGNDPGLLYGDDPRLITVSAPDREVRSPRRLVGFVDTYVQCALLPYVAEVGWADAGRGWRVCGVSVTDSVTDADDTESSTDVRVGLADGEPPMLVPFEDNDEVGVQADGRWQARAIFEVPDDEDENELIVSRDYVLSVDETRVRRSYVERIDLTD